MPINIPRPAPPPQPPAPRAHHCVLISCPNSLEAAEFVVCTAHWYKVKNMCRGKVRQSEFDARLIAVKRRGQGLQAYQCAVCDQWHTGHDHLGEDLEARRKEIAFIINMFRRVRGNYRVNQMIEDWDPANGKYSRYMGVAA